MGEPWKKLESCQVVLLVIPYMRHEPASIEKGICARQSNKNLRCVEHVDKLILQNTLRMAKHRAINRPTRLYVAKDDPCPPYQYRALPSNLVLIPQHLLS